MLAVATLMPALTGLGRGGALDAGFSLVTVTHANMGEAAFGIAPGYAELWATLRTLDDGGMAALVEQAEALTRKTAAENGLGLEISYHDIFHHCENDGQATAMLQAAFEAEGVPHAAAATMRASEDFGLFGSRAGAKSAMFQLGSGLKSPQLHNPDFDFPDELIDPGVRIFARVAANLLG